MSILDSPVTSKEIAKTIAESYQETLRALLGSPSFGPEGKKALELLEQGITLAEIKGITREELDAYFDRGCDCMLSGQLDKAEDIMTKLLLLDSYENRYVYALGGIHQIQHKYEKAAKAYLAFIALDANNPDGYMRLGECLFAVQEYENAKAVFEIARLFAQEGKGSPETLHAAEKMLSTLDEHVGQEESIEDTDGNSEEDVS